MFNSTLTHIAFLWVVLSLNKEPVCIHVHEMHANFFLPPPTIVNTNKMHESTQRNRNKDYDLKIPWDGAKNELVNWFGKFRWTFSVCVRTQKPRATLTKHHEQMIQVHETCYTPPHNRYRNLNRRIALFHLVIRFNHVEFFFSSTEMKISFNASKRCYISHSGSS